MNGFLLLSELLLEYKLSSYFIIVLYKIHLRPSVRKTKSRDSSAGILLLDSKLASLIYSIRFWSAFLLCSFFGF